MPEQAIPDRLVVFSHGKESGPWGTKITHLAEVAKRKGFEVLSPDYRNITDARERVAQLLRLNPQAAKTLVLAGSSMGGYVAAMACQQLKPQGLFLMAPALYFRGWGEEPEGIPQHTHVVHGWNDDIVPPERSQRFAQRNRCVLHMLPSDHGLNDQLPVLAVLFEMALIHALSVKRS